MLIKNRRRNIVNGIYSNRKRWAELMFQFIVFIKLQRGVAYTAQKMKFSIKDFFSKCDQIRRKLLVTFTEEILNGKLHFLCSVILITDNTISKRRRVVVFLIELFFITSKIPICCLTCTERYLRQKGIYVIGFITKHTPL